MFFLFFNVFFVFFKCRVFVVVKTKTCKNYKYDAFLMGKHSVSWTEQVFSSSIIVFNIYVLM